MNMEKIQFLVEELVSAFGMTGHAVNTVTHVVLVIVAILLAALSGWICRKVVVPMVLKLTAKTEAKWDDLLFNERVLKSACSIVPAIVIWLVLPWTFSDFPSVRVVLARPVVTLKSSLSTDSYETLNNLAKVLSDNID